MKKVISVNIDEQVLKQLDDVSKDFGLSRSSALAMMVCFFIKNQVSAQNK